MSVLRTYLKSAGILTLQAIAQRALGIVASIVLVRLLGSTAFGILNAVINTANLGSGLSRFGADGAVHVHMAEKEVARGLSKSQIISAGLLIMTSSGILGSVTFFLLAKWIAQSLFEKPELTVWLRFAAVFILFQSLTQFCYAALAGLSEFRRYAIVMLASAALNVFLVGIGAYVDGLLGALWATIILNASTSVGLIAALVTSSRTKNIQIRLNGLSLASNRLLRLGFPFYISGLIAFPVSYYLQVYLSRKYGVESLAYLRIIGAFTGIIVFIPTSIAAATITTLTEVRSDPERESDKFLEYAILNIKLVWLFCLVAAATICSLLPLLIPLLFGSEYLVALPAARVALFSSVLLAVMTAAANVFFSARRTKLILYQTTVFSIVQIIIGFSLIPNWGLVGYVSAEFGGYLVVVSLIVALLFHEARKVKVNVGPTLVLFILTLFSLFSFLLMTQYVQNEKIVALCSVGLIISLGFVGYQFLLDAREHSGLSKLLMGFWRRVSV